MYMCMCSSSLAACHLFPAIILADTTTPPSPHHLFVIGSRDLCLLSMSWEKIKQIISLFWSPGHNAVSSSQQVDHIWGTPTSGRAGWPHNYGRATDFARESPGKKQCRTTLVACLINLLSSSAKRHHQRLISGLLANTMRLADIKAVLMNKLGIVYGGPLCVNL